LFIYGRLKGTAGST
jgi:hypothetical protein